MERRIDKTLSAAAEESQDKVYRAIVEHARGTVGTRYAALVIPGRDGQLFQYIVASSERDTVTYSGSHPAGTRPINHILIEPQLLHPSDLVDRYGSRDLPFVDSNDSPLLGISIATQGNLLGNLYVIEKQDGNDFAEPDSMVIKDLASVAAGAIEKARLYERIRRRAVLEERERIGMDLHDGIIQSIYAVGLSLELGRMVVLENSEEAQEHMTTAIKGLDNIIRDIRSYIMDLQPARIQDEPLTTALGRLVREFRANTLVQVDVDIPSTIDEGLAENCRLALFHITQEALSNIAKHAHAGTVTVVVGRLSDRIVLKVEDDGAGFDSDKIGGIPGHGLSNMAVRCRSLGGDLTVTSTPGKGTQVHAVVPAQPTTSAPTALVSFP